MTTKSKTEEEKLERKWIQGNRAAVVSMIHHCLGQLGRYEDPTTELARLKAEHEEIIAVLRSACEEYGDNDWPDNLYLPDVIEKHLVRYLEDSPPREQDKSKCICGEPAHYTSIFHTCGKAKCLKATLDACEAEENAETTKRETCEECGHTVSQSWSTKHARCSKSAAHWGLRKRRAVTKVR